MDIGKSIDLLHAGGSRHHGYRSGTATNEAAGRREKSDRQARPIAHKLHDPSSRSPADDNILGPESPEICQGRLEGIQNGVPGDVRCGFAFKCHPECSTSHTSGQRDRLNRIDALSHVQGGVGKDET